MADCLALAALRAARYHAEAEAVLLELSPEGLAALEQEAIRRGLGYDELAAEAFLDPRHHHSPPRRIRAPPGRAPPARLG